MGSGIKYGGWPCMHGNGYEEEMGKAGVVTGHAEVWG